VLGALRQHELTQTANLSNVRLKTEIEQRIRQEYDAFMLTREISHRIKNNLQIIVALINNEIKQTPPEYAQGYLATMARITAIAELYDLTSQSSRGGSVPVDAYLREIARSMSASLLGEASGVRIEVQAKALDIDSDRAVPFGLLVNEPATNAIKHAFPGGAGCVTLGLDQIDDQMELTIADDGVGIRIIDQIGTYQKHGSDYVAIFVRQLEGTIAVSGAPGAGTTVTIRMPLFAPPPIGHVFDPVPDEPPAAGPYGLKPRGPSSVG